MATTRQTNWLGQQRVDVPDLRGLESAIANDFDLLAGKIMTGQSPYIVRGFSIPVTNTAGNPATGLTLNVVNGLVMHYNATEACTLLEVDSSRSLEALNSSNTRLIGSFAAAAINYVGIDYQRYEDSSTSDTTKFLDPNTKQETESDVPKARVLDYKIIITTTPFSFNKNVCPIAIVQTDSGGNVISITDARQLLFRLGSGGDTPNAGSAYTWLDTGRRENPITYNPPTSSSDPFSNGDKGILSLKEWMNAMMMLIWEAKSGEAWYSPTSRDMIKLAMGNPVFIDTGDNFGWDLTTSFFRWKSVKVLFENSSGGYYNNVQDLVVVSNIVRASTTVTVTTATPHNLSNGQLFYLESTDSNFASGIKTVAGVPADSTHFTYTEAGSAVTGSGTFSVFAGAILSDGQCLYVDIDRKTATPTIIPAVGTLQNLPSPVVPGSRIIIAWRQGSLVYVRDKAFEVGRAFNVATTSALGIVQLNQSATVPATAVTSLITQPFVPGIDANGGIKVIATSTIGVEGVGGSVGNNAGVKGTGGGAGPGGSFSSAGGNGIEVIATAGNGAVITGGGGAYGGYFTSGGAAAGVVGLTSGSNIIDITSWGLQTAAIVGGGNNSTSPGGIGVAGVGGTHTFVNRGGVGVYGQGGGTGSGAISITGTSTAGSGVVGIGVDAGYGVYGLGAQNPNSWGGWFENSTFSGGGGVRGHGGSAGIGGYFTGSGSGAGNGDIAVKVDQNIQFAGTNPAATTAFSNVVSSKHITKAWGNYTTNGSGGYTVQDGVNFASAGSGGVINLAAPLANVHGAVTATAYQTSTQSFLHALARVSPVNPAQIFVAVYDQWGVFGAPAFLNLDTVAVTVYFIVHGAQ